MSDGGGKLSPELLARCDTALNELEREVNRQLRENEATLSPESWPPLPPPPPPPPPAPAPLSEDDKEAERALWRQAWEQDRHSREEWNKAATARWRLRALLRAIVENATDRDHRARVLRRLTRLVTAGKLSRQLLERALTESEP